MQTPLVYFTDAVLRGPTIGSMLMCLAAALVGVIVFLRKESLLGESLSHAAYPGIVLAVVLLSPFIGSEITEGSITVVIMAGAFVTALLGLTLINFLETRLKMRSDSALCFVLSGFFGVGLTLASRLQFTHTALYRQAQTYLFGQVATMTDWHVGVYGILAVLTTAVLIMLNKEIQLMIFDEQLAATQGVSVKTINATVFVLIVLAVVIGLRSVGVVLMSAMLIAPAAAARQFTNHFGRMLALSAFFGLVSGFLGNYLSVELSRETFNGEGVRLTLPTGPMIVLVAAFICLMALLIAPDRGLLPRLARILNFRFRCLQENLLKSLWRFGPHAEVSFDQLAQFQSENRLFLWWVLRRLVTNHWIEKVGPSHYRLNHDGEVRAARIVRLHRLWEVYLVDYLGIGAERVHRNAEEMEHILTPELEEQLTRLLKDPKRDPHHQPIPKRHF